MDDKKAKPASNYQKLKSLDQEIQSKNAPRQDFRDYRHSNDDRRKRRSVSPIARDNKKKSTGNPLIVEEVFDHDIPDRSFGDLFCKVCDSHMNSEQMWEAHIQGKRHLKNAKQMEIDGKYTELPLEDALFLKEIKGGKHLIIGLKSCCEIRRHEGKPTYQCFLCSAHIPNASQFIDHLVGLKHRLAYLKENDPTKHDLISKADLKKGMIEPVVEECIQLHFNKYGHGKMQVKQEKPKPIAKKKFDDFFRSKREERKPSPGRRSPPSKSRDPYYDDSDYRTDYHHSSSYPSRDIYDDRRHLSHERDHIFDSQSRDRVFDSQSRDRFFDSQSRDRTFDSQSRDRIFEDYRHNDRSLPPLPSRSLSPLSYSNLDPDRSLSRDKFHDSLLSRTTPSYPQTTGSGNGEDLRAVLDQRKALEKVQQPSLSTPQPTQSNRTQSNNSLYESFAKMVDDLPNMMFFELVVRKLETINPAEEELSILQQIGNSMISIVMKRKLKKLPPDLLNVYKETVNRSPAPATSSGENQTQLSNIPDSLNNLISYLKQGPSTQPKANEEFKNSPPESSPAYVNPSASGFFAPTSNAIPGLTFNERSEDQFTKINPSNINAYMQSAQSYRDFNLRF